MNSMTPHDHRFVPLPIQAAYNWTIASLGHGDCSDAVLTHKDKLLTGRQELWGVPFMLGPQDGANNVILLKDQEVELILPQPLHDRQLLFVHAADFKESFTSPDGIINPMMGTPRLGETVCEYVLHYSDGTEAAFPIRRRYQISEFQLKWGENSFESFPHIKPRTMVTNSDVLHKEAPAIPWGQSQLRTTFPGFGSGMHHWLYALNNPHPDKELIRLVMRPADGTAFIFGITRTSLATNPFRWDARRKARYVSAPGFVPQPFGDNANIGIDLGAIISAAPALEYNHASWLDNPNPPLPAPKQHEWIVEYTAHPDAHLLIRGESPAAIPLRELSASSEWSLMEHTLRRVTVRITEQSSGSKVAAKIHVHGAFGEYIAPLNGHRLPNAHWFEDYGTEYVQDFHYSAYIDGEAEYKLPLGSVYIEVTKGFEIRPVRKHFTITSETNVITIELERVLNWRHKGWVTADTHVHFLSPQTALLEGNAEGVNVVNLLTSQWGEMFSNLGDFDGKTTIGSRENGGSGEYLVRVGTENRQHVLGHISLLGYEGKMIVPLCTGGPDESGLGDPLEATITEWARQCREQNGLVVMPHLPNPRAEGAAALVLGEIDAVEMCSFENVGINPYSLSDWYRYLNCGYHSPAVGGTDKMSQQTAVGTIRTYSLVRSVSFTYDTWMSSIRSGHTFVTLGPLLEFQIGGCVMGSLMQLPGSGGTLDIVWQVSSVTVPVTKIELVVSGLLREEITVDPEVGQYAGHWSIPVKESCWLALRIRGKYHDQSEMIAAHSSAITVIVDGKSCFKSTDAVTILEQIEGSTAYIKTLATRADEQTYKRMLMTLTSAHRALHNRMHQHGILHQHSAVDQHDHHHHAIGRTMNHHASQRSRIRRISGYGIKNNSIHRHGGHKHDHGDGHEHHEHHSHGQDSSAHDDGDPIS
ncbi:CehA/McbA family metallohydrolase [Paenibacillus mendelii]|uniref:CehA/McbA family metallohydrolase n=1 Tax=Paenibacillus mendelii TaxID=206163 RepID=A0ABV6J3Y7_9BACL|nr:CehA/McbA family metallohydrolase [Paenibacillus mendelii]MCQ6559366.1 CehA/McbA family metallohydrolase [Paenibacillus mendelii]